MFYAGFTYAFFSFILCLRQIAFTENHRIFEVVLNCCISAPIGKLAGRYAAEFPYCRVNTVHRNYFIPAEKTNQNNGIDWGLTDVHVVVVDEVRCS